jgi:type I restriction enzyme S subunit
MKWEMIRLGELTKIKTGKLDANASNENGQYPFFTCSKIALKIDTYSYDCECVLVAGNGDLNVKYYNGKFDAYQRTYIVESNNYDVLSVKYLYFFLDKYIEKLRELSIGGVIKYIKLGNLTDALLPLPPLKIQNRITEVLDRASEIVDKRKKQIMLLDQFTKSVFIEMFGDPVTNPKGWELIKLGVCVSKIENGYSPVCLQRSAAENEYGVLKLSAVTNGYYAENENKALPEGMPFRVEIEVKENDLLMTRKNTYELVGMSCYIYKTRSQLMMSDIIFRLITKDNVHKVYLWKLINDSSFRRKIRALANGSAGSMPNISKERLLGLTIPLPPLNLQNQFAAIVEQVEREKRSLNSGLEKLELTYKSLMQKAFNGELFC